MHRARPRRSPRPPGRSRATLAALAALSMLSACSPGDAESDERTTPTPTTVPAPVATTADATPAADNTSATQETESATDDGAEDTADDTDDGAEDTADDTADGAEDAAVAGRPCEVGPVPAVAGLDPFYVQGCDLAGFWVVAGEGVDPEAVTQAAALADAFLGPDPVLARAVLDSGVRLGVIGATQQVTDMPEYRDLPEVFPDVDWNARARGLGSTAARPLVSAGEENLLCLDGDRYRGEDILLHEFAHTLHLQGLAIVDPDFDDDLLAAYTAAMAEGIWVDTYASTNPEEYWAEGVQSYFERNLSAVVADGIHGPIDTRQELADADPALFALIDERFASVRLPPTCQDP
ncbi:MAG: hypothetical protein AAGA59_12585 [Actinomycetota bacterium]